MWGGKVHLEIQLQWSPWERKQLGFGIFFLCFLGCIQEKTNYNRGFGEIIWNTMQRPAEWAV